MVDHGRSIDHGLIMVHHGRSIDHGKSIDHGLIMVIMVDHWLIRVDFSFTLSIILQDASLHRSVKTVILSTLGDIAIAVGADFKVYYESVAVMLQQASTVQVDKVDYASCDVM